MLINPKISILIPVYNAATYLMECLDSVTNQTLRDIEIICVNDGSVDSSLKILQEYAKADRRIRIINKVKNEGILLARKSAVLQAKGKYIVFVDSDDLLSHPTSLRTMLEMMEYEQVDIFQFSVELLYECGTLKPADGWHKVYEKKLSGNLAIISACIDAKYNWCLWNKIFRAECCIKAFQAIEDIYLVTAEDCYVYFLIAYYAETFLGKTGQPLYTYRQGSGVTARRTLDLSLFEMFCRENVIVTRLGAFLQRESLAKDQRIFFEKILDNLKLRFLRHCILRYDQLEEKSQEGAHLFLQRYFGIDFVFRNILHQLRNARAELRQAFLEVEFAKKYKTLRVDIRNNGDGCNIKEQSVDPKPLKLHRPEWLLNGISIESSSETMTVDLMCIGDGELRIDLRGGDRRNSDGNRYPLWVDCTGFSVNGKNVFNRVQTVCHDRPYVYRKSVEDGEVIHLTFEWRECQSNFILDENRRLERNLERSQTELSRMQSSLQNKENVRKQFQKFSIWKYLKLKCLSKISFGSFAKVVSERYREQERLYKMIRGK